MNSSQKNTNHILRQLYENNININKAEIESKASKALKNIYETLGGSQNQDENIEKYKSDISKLKENFSNMSNLPVDQYEQNIGENELFLSSLLFTLSLINGLSLLGESSPIQATSAIQKMFKTLVSTPEKIGNLHIFSMYKNASDEEKINVIELNFYDQKQEINLTDDLDEKKATQKVLSQHLNTLSTVLVDFESSSSKDAISQWKSQLIDLYPENSQTEGKGVSADIAAPEEGEVQADVAAPEEGKGVSADVAAPEEGEVQADVAAPEEGKGVSADVAAPAAPAEQGAAKIGFIARNKIPFMIFTPLFIISIFVVGFMLWKRSKKNKANNKKNENKKTENTEEEQKK